MVGPNRKNLPIDCGGIAKASGMLKRKARLDRWRLGCGRRRRGLLR
jgi:hypothetical protein